MQTGKTSTVKECLGYDTKLHLNGEVPFFGDLGVWSIPPLLLVPGPLRSRVIVPIRMLSMDQIDLFKKTFVLRIVT